MCLLAAHGGVHLFTDLSVATYVAATCVSVQISCRVRGPAVCSVHALICTVFASSAQSGGDERWMEGGRRTERRPNEESTVANNPPLFVLRPARNRCWMY